MDKYQLEFDNNGNYNIIIYHASNDEDACNKASAFARMAEQAFGEIKIAAIQCGERVVYQKE